MVIESFLEGRIEVVGLLSKSGDSPGPRTRTNLTAAGHQRRSGIKTPTATELGP